MFFGNLEVSTRQKSMKAIRPYLVLNMRATATSENSFGFSSATMVQIMNPASLIYSKYFTKQLLFQLVTVNPVELLPTCIFSKLNVNELKNLNCICHELVHQGHGSLVPFIICSC